MSEYDTEGWPLPELQLSPGDAPDTPMCGRACLIAKTVIVSGAARARFALCANPERHLFCPWVPQGQRLSGRGCPGPSRFGRGCHKAKRRSRRVPQGWGFSGLGVSQARECSRRGCSSVGRCAPVAVITMGGVGCEACQARSREPSRNLAGPALRDAPIGDVAARWGYRGQAYFSRLFRRAFPGCSAGVRRDAAGVAGAGRGALVDWLNSAADPLNSGDLPGNPLGTRFVFCRVRSQTLTGGAVAALHRRGAGRWSVPVAAIVAVALALGVCAALVVNRIDDGTAAVGDASFVVASAHTGPPIAASSIAGPTAANR